MAQSAVSHPLTDGLRETPREYYGFTVLTGDFDNDGWPDFSV
jgi:hypothetical protein